MKKIKTLLLAFAIVLTALQSPVQVSAHGHGSGGGNAQPGYYLHDREEES